MFTMKSFGEMTHAFYPDEERFAGRKVALISVAAQSGYPSHERSMSWLRHYGAEYVAKVRLRAREKDDLRQRRGQMERLEAFAADLVRLLR